VAVRTGELPIDVDRHASLDGTWPGCVAREDTSGCGSDDQCLGLIKETQRNLHCLPRVRLLGPIRRVTRIVSELPGQQHDSPRAPRDADRERQELPSLNAPTIQERPDRSANLKDR